jgi:hypothetical protein
MLSVALLSVIMLSVVMLNAIMLNVVMLNAVMLSVLEPKLQTQWVDIHLMGKIEFVDWNGFIQFRREQTAAMEHQTFSKIKFWAKKGLWPGSIVVERWTHNPKKLGLNESQMNEFLNFEKN